MKALPRGIRSYRAPSCGINDAAYLCNRNPIFGCKSSLSSSWPVFGSVAYFYGLLRRYFCGYGFFTILHSAVLAHIHLVVSMGRPPKIANVVVAWIAVIMRNVSERLIFRHTKKRQCDEPMGEPSNRLAGRISKYVSNISVARSCSANWDGACSPTRLFVRNSPLSSFFSPRADVPILINFILLKPGYCFPIGHTITHSNLI